MTEGTSQGLFVVVAIVIFGIFVGLTYTLFGSEGLSNDLENIFAQSVDKAEFNKDKEYNVDGVTPNVESDFVFDGVNTITGYIGTSTEVVIPNTINGKTITTISGDAFNAKGITKLIMPNSITTIEDGSIVTDTAFIDTNKELKGTTLSINIKNLLIMSVSADELPTKQVIGAFANNDIKEISFSANIDYIGSFAFFSGSLENVALPEGLLEIGESAFEENTLTDIKIPATVTKLGNNSFKNNALKYISYGKGSNLNLIGSSVFSGNNITDLEIPKGTTEIAENAYSNLGIEKVEIPQGVTKIGKNAFSNNKLKEVNIPDSVIEIDNNAFKDNTLTNVTLPMGLQRIGDYAFYKNKLPIVNLPESLILIGSHAFEYNELLDVKIPSKLTALKERTFAHNKMPKKPTIPVNIKTEENEVFYGNLFTVEKPKTQPDYYEGKNVVVTKEGILFSNGTITGYTGAAKNIVIPYEINGIPVTTIGVDAFRNKGLTSVLIPNSIKNIDNQAFYMNYLNTVDIPNSVLNLGFNSFSTNKLTSVKIPDSVTKIGAAAFFNNSISSVEIGNSVTEIQPQAFQYNKLISVTLPDSVKTVWINAFTNNPSLTNVELPSSFNLVEGSFQSGATIKYRTVLQ